jgi:leader peptidase (prepilin peptidase)/N-methyltransferase
MAIIALGLAGLIWGLACDRVSARWPAHEDAVVRAVGWRTLVVAGFGAVAMAALPARFPGTEERLLFGAWFAAMILLMATDLDQRVMPDVVTLPLIALGALALAWGGDTLVNRSPAWEAVAGAVIVPGLLLASSMPFGAGALGLGDVKFMVGVGLMTGLVRVVISLVAGALVGGAVVGGLLVTRRIGLRSYVPYGPFLIAGALWATLLPASQ